MVILSFIARKLYKRILPDIDYPSTNSNAVAQVCVVSNHISTIGAIMAVENNNNNIFVSDKNKSNSEDSASAESNLNTLDEVIKIRF